MYSFHYQRKPLLLRFILGTIRFNRSIINSLNDEPYISISQHEVLEYYLQSIPPIPIKALFYLKKVYVLMWILDFLVKDCRLNICIYHQPLLKPYYNYNEGIRCWYTKRIWVNLREQEIYQNFRSKRANSPSVTIYYIEHKRMSLRNSRMWKPRN